MTQENKKLLLRDLCARLPYGVILLSQNGKVTYQTDGNTAAELLVEEGWKPYLRPMSSMTEEDNVSLSKYVGCSIRAKYGEIYFPNIEDNTLNKFEKVFDWLNTHHFDYRGLIEKGLAIAITENNNPYKK